MDNTANLSEKIVYFNCLSEDSSLESLVEKIKSDLENNHLI